MNPPIAGFRARKLFSVSILTVLCCASLPGCFFTHAVLDSGRTYESPTTMYGIIDNGDEHYVAVTEFTYYTIRLFYRRHEASRAVKLVYFDLEPSDIRKAQEARTSRQDGSSTPTISLGPIFRDEKRSAIIPLKFKKGLTALQLEESMDKVNIPGGRVDHNSMVFPVTSPNGEIRLFFTEGMMTGRDWLVPLSPMHRRSRRAWWAYPVLLTLPVAVVADAVVDTGLIIGAYAWELGRVF